MFCGHAADSPPIRLADVSDTGADGYSVERVQLSFMGFILTYSSIELEKLNAGIHTNDLNGPGELIYSGHTRLTDRCAP